MTGWFRRLCGTIGNSPSTGSGSGLGRRIAEAALEAGNRVVATALDTADLAGLKEHYGVNVLIERLDVTDEEQGRAALSEYEPSVGARYAADEGLLGQ
jgi:NADP-dependent 3-hydroxy acid dehydrogenase YdfG